MKANIEEEQNSLSYYGYNPFEEVAKDLCKEAFNTLFSTKGFIPTFRRVALKEEAKKVKQLRLSCETVMSSRSAGTYFCMAYLLIHDEEEWQKAQGRIRDQMTYFVMLKYEPMTEPYRFFSHAQREDYKKEQDKKRREWQEGNQRAAQARFAREAMLKSFDWRRK